MRIGAFDGSWRTGNLNYTITGDRLKDSGGNELKLDIIRQDTFAIDNVSAQITSDKITWQNGTVWTAAKAGEFDGRWTDKRDPGKDLFYIEGREMFFDDGFEVTISGSGNDTFLVGQMFDDTYRGHHVGQLVKGEIRWDSGDVWTPVIVTTTVTTTSSTTTSSPTTTTVSSTSTPTATVTSTTVTPTATTSTSYTRSTTTTTDTSSKSFCFEPHVYWEPLDMDGWTESMEVDAFACRSRCANSAGCAHFSYSKTDGGCHLQDIAAFRVVGQVDVLSGPPFCDSRNQAMAHVQDHGVGNFTFAPRDEGCLEVATTYSPLLSLPLLVFQDFEVPNAIAACQRRCSRTDGCFRFVLEVALRQCFLAAAGSVKTHPAFGFVSGARDCRNQAEGEFDDQEILFLDPPAGDQGMLLKRRNNAALFLAVVTATMVMLHLHRTGRCVRLARSWPHRGIESGFDSSRSTSARDALISPAWPRFVEENLPSYVARGMPMFVSFDPGRGQHGYIVIRDDNPVLNSDGEIVSDNEADEAVNFA